MGPDFCKGRMGYNNSLRAKFSSRNINMYLQFLLFLHIDMTLEVEILPHVRQGPTVTRYC